MLELDEGKLSRPVLRRGDGNNSVSLAGEFVDGGSEPLRGGVLFHEPLLFERDRLENGKEMPSASASIDALQTARN